MTESDHEKNKLGRGVFENFRFQISDFRIRDSNFKYQTSEIYSEICNLKSEIFKDPVPNLFFFTFRFSRELSERHLNDKLKFIGHPSGGHGSERAN